VALAAAEAPQLSPQQFSAENPHILWLGVEKDKK
jgi:hypothetical protein